MGLAATPALLFGEGEILSDNLVRYNAARKALAEAVRVDEVKEILSEAAAIRAYAEQAKDTSLIEGATELRKRAERRLGEMMKIQAETVGLNKGGRPSKKTGVSETPVSKPTLDENDIDKNLAKRARKAAALPPEEFEAQVQEAKAAAARSIAKPVRVGGVADGKPKSKKRRADISDAKKQAMACANLDEGKSRQQVAAEFGVGENTVSIAVAEEVGRREPLIELKTLPLSDQERLEAAIKLETRRLEAEFEKRVLDEIARRIDEMVLPQYRQEMAEARAVIKARKGIMSREIFRLILSCLHPDQSASPDRIRKAFEAFKERELVMCNEKEMPTTPGAIPRSYDEMINRQAEMKASRAPSKSRRKQQSNVPERTH